MANKLRKIVGAVLKKDLSKATTADILSLLKQLNPNPHTENVSQGNTQETRYSLNESADSEFAKAVDAVANGEDPSSPIITLGKTPDVLKMLGIDDAKVVIPVRVLRKDMIGKHAVSADAMKQLPKQMNNPVAVMQSRESSTNPEAYLVLTELKEVERNKEMPVIAALKFTKNKNGDLELIEVASAYGRKNIKVAKDLESGVLYWNKEKGNHFFDNFSLSAESNFNLSALRTLLSNNDYLSARNIKTESDLSQYQNSKETRYSLNESADSEFAKAVDVVSKGGSVKGYIDVGTTPDVLKMLGLPDVKVTIHGATFKKVMQDKHHITAETLKQLPQQINNPVAVMRSSTENNGYVVLTELIENVNGANKPVIAALHLKQDVNGLELINIASVYGRNHSQIQRGLDNDLLYLNKEKGKNFADTFGLQLPAYVSQDSPLAANIKTESDLSQYQNNKETRYSLNESADSEFAKAVERASNGYKGSHKRFIKMGTTPNVLKMIGLPNTIVSMREDVFHKVLSGGKHFLTADDLKHLPSQINNPIAVTRSRTKDNGYLVFTELTENVDGVDKPVIAALHIKEKNNGLEVIDVASAYGRNISQINEYLKQVLYWNKTKGYPFANRAGLQLPNVLLSKDNLSGFNIKTESDLSQYQHSPSNQKNTEADAEIQQDRQFLQKILGDVANQIELVRAVIANSTTGEKYYDHKLSEIEKGDILEMTSRLSSAEISNQSPSLDDKRLLQILQDKSEDKSAVEDQNLSEQRYSQEKENGEHDYKDPDHLQSIAAIPQIIENAIYVDTLPNEDKEKHPNIQRYDYYVAGLNIGGDNYTVKAVVSTAKDGSRYYDHKLSEIEKGELLSRTSRITTPVDKSNSPFNEFDDKRLLQILQDKSAGENEENIRYFQRSTNRLKFERFERLCQMKSIQISGKDIYSQAVIFVSICKNVLEYGKALRGIYINVDTGYEINLGHSRVEKRRSFGNDLSRINCGDFQSIAYWP
ncbi:hypothetical protein [Avibacterium endocarditidis]|uniref:MuF-C-terminal domain-containing protein n=1 Tax=Avibacterium TaxID=292486 RepID=UPI0039FC4D3A